MLEVVEDLFCPPRGALAVCITTNGVRTSAGAAVMGKGVAYQAKLRWPGVERVLGHLLATQGNHVHELTSSRTLFGEEAIVSGRDQHRLSWRLYSFPTKHDWRSKSDPDLIRRSARELKTALGSIQRPVYLPRPGCGNGQLPWHEVRKILEQELPEDMWRVVYERA